MTPPAVGGPAAIGGRGSRRWIAPFLLALMAALPVIGLEPQTSDLDGLPIVRIVLIRHNIFDATNPKTSSWPYRAANAVHIVTREGFIRKALLFKEGDPYSASRAAESARILRSLGFMNPVDITAHRIEGGVEVIVETRDLWTLEVGGTFGSHAEKGLSFVEQNFLGSGRELSIDWKSTNERTSWTYSYLDPLVMGSRWQLRLVHENRSDGFRDLVRAEYPFYSLATTRSWGVEWRNERLVDHLYSDGDTVVKGVHRTNSWRLWGGLRLPGSGDIVRRVTLGWEHQNDRFEDWRWVNGDEPYATSPDRKVEGVRIGYEQIADRYIVLHGFRAWTVQEDVALGPNYSLGLTASLPSLGGDERRFVVDGHMSTAIRSGDWLHLFSAWTSGRLEAGGARDFVAGVQVATTQIGTRGWQARLMVEDSHHLDPQRQLTLGADVGLRGWDADTFDGTGRAVLNVQYRALVKRDILNIFSLGVVGFVDSGYTWGARVGRSTGGVRNDAGIGLLADMTHLGLAQLVRLDVGFPDDGSGYVITLTSSTLF